MIVFSFEFSVEQSHRERARLSSDLNTEFYQKREINFLYFLHQYAAVASRYFSIFFDFTKSSANIASTRYKMSSR